MRRYFTAGVITALTLAAGTAQAQVDVQQPVVGNDEFAGLNTIVTFDVPAALNGGGIVLDGEALEVSFDLINDAGDVVFGPFSVNTVGGAVNYVNAAGNAGVQVDLSEVTFGTALANASVTGIRLKLRTTGGTAMMFESAVLDGDEANDEVLTAVKSGDAPNLINVFISTDGANAFLEFDQSLNVGAGGNDDNQTVIGDIDGTDFQIDTSDNFDGTEGAPAGLSNPAFVGATNNFIRFDRNDATTDLNVNTWIRPSFDNVPASQNDIFSIVGYAATDTAVQAVAQSALTITSVEALAAVNSGSGANAMVIRVNYNLPLNAADLGDDTFYGDALQLNAGGDSTLDITAIAADPDNSNAVLLTITAGAGDSILTNALNGDDGLALSLDTDTDGGDVPSSIFTADDYATDQSIELTDAIAPALDGDVYFKDSDGDGVQDGVILVFTETLASASASDQGIVLTRNAGVTLNPIGMIDSVTGVMTSYDTVASDDADDDVIDITGVELMSFDADGDGEISDLETDNAICVSFDPTQDFGVVGGGWDNDDETTAGTGDGPGTGDDGAINVTVDADDSDIEDANGVGIDTDADTDDTDDIDEDSDGDFAAPVAINSSYRSGDNFIGGDFDTFVETDGNVGDDDDNNVFYAVFSEALDTFAARGGPEDLTRISWGPGANDRFGAGSSFDFVGDDGNILVLEDSDANGFAPGDTVLFSDGVGIGDDEDNQILGSFAAPDATPPFVALQTDINGNDVLSAFLFDTSDPADGFANEVRLFTGAPVDPATVLLGDFSYSGGEDFDSIEVNASGQQITLTFPSGAQLPLANNITVSYTAPANNDDMDSQIIAGTGGNSVFPGLTSNITAREFPTPDVDTDDLAVMDIRGDITMGGNPIGVGAKVYGFVAVPTPKMISGVINGIDFWLDDDNSLESFWDFIYGFESHLYFFDNDGEIWFDNDYEDYSDDNYAIYDVSVNAANLSSVTFTARGRSYTEGDSVPQTNLTVTGGRVTMGWDVLRSNNGTIDGLKSSGFEVDGDAIASRAVVSGADGAYAMHLSAPITQIYTSFGTTGWPVIMVVEEATGTRYPATSIHNAVDNEGTLFFRSLQRDTDPNDDNDRTGTSSGSNLVFDINLDNVGMEYLYQGWSLLPFDRVSGFASTAGNIPTLPAIQGSDNSNVVVNNTLPLTRAFNQFCYFEDANSDGMWTSADDGDFFDSLFVDVNCFEHMRFTMTNRGVNVGSGVGAFIGGYGAGFYNGHFNNIGVFQFGAMGTATEVFSGTFSSTSTLGWAIVTAPESSDDPTAFLNTNDADFMIEFNRISNGEVDVNTQGNETDNINDVVEINAGQAYFISFE